jgi:hypothetical protein
MQQPLSLQLKMKASSSTRKRLAKWMGSYEAVAGCVARHGDLEQLLLQGGGIARLPDFAPDWVAAGILELLEGLEDQEWNVSEGMQALLCTAPQPHVALRPPTRSRRRQHWLAAAAAAAAMAMAAGAAAPLQLFTHLPPCHCHCHSDHARQRRPAAEQHRTHIPVDQVSRVGGRVPHAQPAAARLTLDVLRRQVLLPRPHQAARRPRLHAGQQALACLAVQCLWGLPAVGEADSRVSTVGACG